MSQQQAVESAKSAFQDFGGKLKGELQKALGEGGAVQAIDVCRKEAPQIARDISTEHGFAVGRSSHRPRNRDNAPTEAIESYLKKHSDEGEKAPLEAVQEGDQWLVIAPIITQPLCVSCHGDPDTFSPELREALKTHYPNDEATGFKPGDLRGVFWARLP